MPFSNYIYEYYDGISSGNITVGKWVRLLYEYIVKGLQEGLFTFNAKKANKAIRFIENFCHHCEGRTDLLKLELWQKAAVSVMFGIVEEDGTRVFREVFIVIGRKNGKTLFASAVIAYMAYLDGEYGAKIYCLAPKLEQANIVYDNFYQMIKKRTGAFRPIEEAPFRYLHRRKQYRDQAACVQRKEIRRLQSAFSRER